MVISLEKAISLLSVLVWEAFRDDDARVGGVLGCCGREKVFTYHWDLCGCCLVDLPALLPAKTQILNHIVTFIL